MCEPDSDPKATEASSTRSNENETATVSNEDAQVTKNDVVKSGKAHRSSTNCGGLFLSLLV
jgi:hypothetical protein